MKKVLKKVMSALFFCVTLATTIQLNGMSEKSFNDLRKIVEATTKPESPASSVSTHSYRSIPNSPESFPPSPAVHFVQKGLDNPFPPLRFFPIDEEKEEFNTECLVATFIIQMKKNCKHASDEERTAIEERLSLLLSEGVSNDRREAILSILDNERKGLLKIHEAVELISKIIND